MWYSNFKVVTILVVMRYVFVIVNPIWSLLYDPIDPLFLQKKSVCVYHFYFQRYMDIKLV